MIEQVALGSVVGEISHVKTRGEDFLRRGGPGAPRGARLPFRPCRPVLAPALALSPMLGTSMDAKQLFQPAPEAALFGLAPAGFVAESATSSVAVVAPAPGPGDQPDERRPVWGGVAA
ncbi:MAG: hypothetical protein EBS49_08475 [Verrucomicrobia bacterium]|nr:hypothetical protein [Verrucomicrobiota bacterium]